MCYKKFTHIYMCVCTLIAHNKYMLLKRFVCVVLKDGYELLQYT